MARGAGVAVDAGPRPAAPCIRRRGARGVTAGPHARRPPRPVGAGPTTRRRPGVRRAEILRGLPARRYARPPHRPGARRHRAPDCLAAPRCASARAGRVDGMVAEERARRVLVVPAAGGAARRWRAPARRRASGRRARPCRPRPGAWRREARRDPRGSTRSRTARGAAARTRATRPITVAPQPRRSRFPSDVALRRRRSIQARRRVGRRSTTTNADGLSAPWWGSRRRGLESRRPDLAGRSPAAIRRAGLCCRAPHRLTASDDSSHASTTPSVTTWPSALRPARRLLRHPVRVGAWLSAHTR